MKPNEERIKELADKIRKQIKTTSFMGVALDVENIDHAIVAAYMEGQNSIWPPAADGEHKKEMIA
jgi:hypothetical protein